MDFLALPRRDLQALCKLNGVRANMTNVAMADALCALPKVDGIEEYVKQPAPAPEPEVLVAAVEEKNVGKKGNPLPRGRRGVAKSSEPIEPEEGDDEEKGNATKPQPSKEDVPALGRGASRRVRLVPVVPDLAAMAQDAFKREAKRNKAPAPVAGRRTRPTRAVAAQAAESEVACAEEEQREEVEDPKREATVDDVPALGVGRRGASRRARPAPSVAAMAGKAVAEEEQRAQIPLGRCVRTTAKGTSSEPIRLGDSDDEEQQDGKPEEQQEDAQVLGVCLRGRASRRAQAAPAVAAPEATAQEEQRAPVPCGRRAKANSTELISDVTVEAVPIRPTRQRKPTMKAAVAGAAAEEKAPGRAPRRGAVMSTFLQQEVQEEPQEAVGAPDMAAEAVPIRATRKRKPTMKAAAVAEEKAPPRATRRDTLQKEIQEHPQDVVINEDDQFETVSADNLLEQVTGLEITVAENTAPRVDDRQQSTVTMDEDVVKDYSETDDVHSNEQIEVVTTDKVPELELTEDVFVQADHVVAAENLSEVIDSEIILEATSLLVDENQQSIVTMDEDVVKDYSETDDVHSNEQIEVVTTDKVPELELTEDVFVQADHVVAADNLSEQVTDSEIILKATSLLVDENQQSTVLKDEDVVKDYSETDGVHSNEQIEVATTDKVPELQMIEDVSVQADHVAAVVNLPEQVIDCEIILETSSLIVDEKHKSTVTMDIDVVNDHFKTDDHADEQMEVATTDEEAKLTETDDEGVEEMKTPLIVDEKQQSIATLNGEIVVDHFKTHVAHADEQKEVVATEEVTRTDSEIEKTPLTVHEKKHNTVTTNGNVVFDHFKTDTAHADEEKEVTGIVTEVPDEVTGTGDEGIEEKAVVISEDITNQGTIPSVTNIMDESAKENHFGTDFGHGNEQKIAITAEIEPEVSRALDGGARAEIALPDDITVSLSKSIITMEPSVCKNSSGKNSAEPMAVLEEKAVKVVKSIITKEPSLCKNSSGKNSAEPMTVLEEKRVKASSESEDLTKLSLGQLRAMLKEKLKAKKNKEAKKRVALARVDENVCRSRAKVQQQDLNLQQH